MYHLVRFAMKYHQGLLSLPNILYDQFVLGFGLRGRLRIEDPAFLPALEKNWYRKKQGQK